VSVIAGQRAGVLVDGGGVLVWRLGRLRDEWKNKDPLFDRDLFELHALGVGIILTKCNELETLFLALFPWLLRPEFRQPHEKFPFPVGRRPLSHAQHLDLRNRTGVNRHAFDQTVRSSNLNLRKGCYP